MNHDAGDQGFSVAEGLGEGLHVLGHILAGLDQRGLELGQDLGRDRLEALGKGPELDGEVATGRGSGVLGHNRSRWNVAGQGLAIGSQELGEAVGHSGPGAAEGHGLTLFILWAASWRTASVIGARTDAARGVPM